MPLLHINITSLALRSVVALRLDEDFLDECGNYSFDARADDVQDVVLGGVIDAAVMAGSADRSHGIAGGSLLGGVACVCAMLTWEVQGKGVGQEFIIVYSQR